MSIKMPTRPARHYLVTVASLTGLLVLWGIGSLVLAEPSIFPAPWVVAPLVWAELVHGQLLFHMGATLARVAAGFVIAMTVGSAIGIIMGMWRKADRWMDPVLVVFLNLPALVTIVLCYLWIGLGEAAAITAVALNKIPMVATMMREGARVLDPALTDMARVFDMSRVSRLRHIVLPQLAPYFAGAARAGLALIWKIVLVVEFLGRSNGIGFKIHLYFQLFDVAMVLAYSLSFVAVMLVIEKLILQPIERRASDWRRA
ncbi:ABC transporter permease [Pseudogemmobacter sp. W21_MBD1_M6]|uniref:ABC transporter permease n=1 Tax=Pseudogemmobacter sp. W21_MBD1_M6 TaxID=3240271 RepID=UPI003F969704